MVVETLVAKRWGIRRHIIVPNVHWGLGLHECDVLIVSASGYATEVEIKISKSDLKKDLRKRHGHRNRKIKYLYFAIPEKLENCLDLIPEYAGVLIVRKHSSVTNAGYYIDKIKDSRANQNAVKLDGNEMSQLMRLGCMRIWALKERLIGIE